MKIYRWFLILTVLLACPLFAASPLNLGQALNNAIEQAKTGAPIVQYLMDQVDSDVVVGQAPFTIGTGCTDGVTPTGNPYISGDVTCDSNGEIILTYKSSAISPVLAGLQLTFIPRNSGGVAFTPATDDGIASWSCTYAIPLGQSMMFFGQNFGNFFQQSLYPLTLCTTA